MTVTPPEGEQDSAPAVRGRALVAHMREAAQQNTPVVVAPLDAELKLRAYLAAVEGPAHAPLLRLCPIAADAVASPRFDRSGVRIHGLHPERPWLLTVDSISAVDGDSAQVPLAQAELRFGDSHAQQPTLHPAHRALVLVIPGGLPELTSHVFPVVEIGAQDCIVESTAALPLASDLPWVELVGERRVLRVAAARVIEVVPWRMEDGGRRFRCRLALSPSDSRDPMHAYDLLTDPGQARALIESATTLMTAAWLQWGEGLHSTATLLETDKASLTLETDQALAPLPPRTPMRLGFEHACIHYEATLHLLQHAGRFLQVSCPLVLRRRFRHRRAVRVAIAPEHEVQLAFRHPALGRMTARAVVDVSFLGVAFQADPERDPLWAGLSLEDATLSWGKREASLGDLEILAIEAREKGRPAVCRARTMHGGLAEDPVLIDLLATVGHPQVRVDRGDDFESMLSLYREAGLFAPHMHRNLEGSLDAIEDLWKRLHGEGGGLMRTVVYPAQGQPEGAVSVVRAWERAWLYQHFVCVRPTVRGAAGRLQTAILDHVLPRPDGHFVVFFVKADNRVMNAYYERFFAAAGTPESFERQMIALWVQRAGAAASPPPEAEGDGCRIEMLTEDEETLVARAAERRFGRMIATALSFQPGELSIPDTTSRMQHIGVSRTRHCYGVRQGKVLTHALIEERAPAGFNLTWMLNAWWLLPVGDSAHRESAIAAALQHITTLPAQAPSGDRFLMVPCGMPTETLTTHGFELIADVYTYVLNRAGLHRYFQYTAGRYGAIESRAGARRRGRRR